MEVDWQQIVFVRFVVLVEVALRLNFRSKTAMSTEGRPLWRQPRSSRAKVEPCLTGPIRNQNWQAHLVMRYSTHRFGQYIRTTSELNCEFAVERSKHPWSTHRFDTLDTLVFLLVRISPTRIETSTRNRSRPLCPPTIVNHDNFEKPQTQSIACAIVEVREGPGVAQAREGWTSARSTVGEPQRIWTSAHRRGESCLQ